MSRVDWDEHFAYITTYKVATWYTPYQLVYGLNHVMLTKYVLSTFSGDHGDVNHVKIFTSILINLKKLHIDILQTHETIGN
jgi:hypothetical protein